MDLIWYCCDDYGRNPARDKAILDFAKGRRRVRISVFPFASDRSIAQLQNFIRVNTSSQVQVGAHLYLSEFVPMSKCSDSPLFSDKISLASSCFELAKRELILNELRLQQVTLLKHFNVEFYNFHHNIHHTRAFIDFIADQNVLPVHSLRNVAIVASGIGGWYNRVFHPTKYLLYREIASSFKDERVNLFMSGKRYKYWRFLTTEKMVELMFHPGDERMEYVQECNSYSQ